MMTIPRLWLLAASLTAASHIWLVYQTQGIETMMLVALAWSGAALCLEDRFTDLDPRPTGSSLAAAVLLLAFCLWRTSHIFHRDVTIYVLCLLQGLGLVLLLTAWRQVTGFLAPLACLSTPIVPVLLQHLIPVSWLSQLTARVTQGALLIFGQEAAVRGSEVWLSGGGVRIAGSCSGTESVKLLVVIGIIFLLAFPLPDKRSRAFFALLAPVAAVIGNAFRIGCLALINASDLADRKALFDFFHEEHGSLVFSLITASLFAWIYLGALDFQLKQQERRHAA